MIGVRDVEKSFGKEKVLRGISLSIANILALKKHRRL
jgi:ABC-type histidine transport system ATPase subunit